MSGATRQTRRERLQEKEQAIIAAAQVEFLEHGFEGARVARIARGADMAEGTIYLYFKNKNALLLAVVRAFYDRLTSGASEGIRKYNTTRERLEFLALHHLEHCIAEWGIIEQVAAAYRLVDEYQGSEYMAFNRTYVAVFDSVIREGVSRGDIRKDIPLQVIRDLFYGALEYSARTHMIRASGAHKPGRIRELADQLIAMIMPALGLNPVASDTPSLGPLQAVTERLEAVADQLEARRQS